MIEVKDLVKQYGKNMAVDHLSFTVEDGQIYGFLGPNGAGKSTTMNIMTGYLGANSGTVIINGHDIVNDAKEAKKCIGYLPELPPLYDNMTVTEYLKFSAELKSIPKGERGNQIQEAMNLTGTNEVAGRLIKNLSKGFRQRVGMAQAILGFPDVIILDEPTVGLDPKQIIEIRQVIKELGKKHTVILSSHILSEVSAICDHIMIISHGKLVASDTPENLAKLNEKKQTIKLSVKGSKEAVESVLSMMENVESIKYVGTLEDAENVQPFEVTAVANKDIREDILDEFAKNKLPIYEMASEMVSLEDVFLDLTSDEHLEKLKEEEAAEAAAEKSEDFKEEDMPKKSFKLKLGKKVKKMEAPTTEEFKEDTKATKSDEKEDK